MIVICLSAVLQVSAQQAPIFTDFTKSFAVVNPAFCGMNQGINVMGINRMQWSGFGVELAESDQAATTSDATASSSVAPQTFFLSLDMPVKFMHGGVGLSVVQDKIGFEENVNIGLSYAYHIDFGLSDFAFGMGVNVLNRSVDFTKFNPIDPGDPVLEGLSSDASDMFLDVNIGAFWQIPGEAYLGFAANNILETEGTNLLANSTTTSASFIGDRTFYFFGGYEYQPQSIPLCTLLPSFCFITDIASAQINIGVNAMYNNLFSVGVNYRYEESIGFMVGLNIKDIQIGYAYDLNTFGLSVPGSHEISLRYCFKINGDKSAREYKSVRYL